MNYVTEKKNLILESDNQIYDRLKKLRESRKLSRTTLAQKFGVCADLIKRLESGTRNLTIDHLSAYHNFFRVSYDYILDGKGSKNSPEKLAEEIANLPADEKKELLKMVIDLI